MNVHLFGILLASSLLGATLAGALIWRRATPRLIYGAFAVFGLISGCAYNWAYGMAVPGPGFMMLGVCSLLWLQGAWLVTRLLLPRL
jgi:hypothetical protein